MKAKLLLLLLLISYLGKAQTYGSLSMMESDYIEYKGIKFLVQVHIAIEATDVGGMGDRMYRVRLTQLSSSIHDKYEVIYKGKTYYQHSFNNGLARLLSNQNLEVNKVDVSVELTGSKDCGNTSLTGASEGSSKSILCGVEKDKKLGIARIKINTASFNGFQELFAEIDKFETLAATTKEKPASPSTTNSNSINQPKPLPSNSPNNYGTNQKTGTNQQAPSNQTNTRTTSFDNFNQPIIKVNANGYDTKGNYVGTGTYNNSGSGTFIPAGPGKLRTDGNYDVVDKSTGKVEVVSKSENQRLLQLQEQKTQAANFQQQQQKIQDQFKQQQLARQQLAASQAASAAQMNAFTDQAANAIANIATGIGNIIANNKAKKEAEKRRQALLAEQERLRLAAIEAEKKFRYDSRKNLFDNYKPGNIPGSTSKLPYNFLYYFIYAYDETALSNSTLPLYISNIVELKKASDGTWPYQRTIYEDIASLSPYTEIFHGFYTSEEEAEIAKNGFITMHQQVGANIKEIQYKKRTTTSKINTTNIGKQFWDTSFTVHPKETTTKTIENTKAIDPLWDINSTVNNKVISTDSSTASIQTKKKIDFWGEEDIKPKSSSAISQESVNPATIAEIFNSLQQNETKKALELVNKFPAETNDLSFESLRAHCYLLSDQVVKALDVYKKHKGKAIAGSGILWEEKVKKDIEQFQQKGIQHQHFPLILTMLM